MNSFDKKRIGILKSRNSSWTLDFIINSLSNVIDIYSLKEEGTSNQNLNLPSWERSKGILDFEQFSNLDGVIVPICFPYLDSQILCRDLNKLKASGVPIISFLLDPIGTDSMKMLLESSSQIVVFDNRDLQTLINLNISSDNIKQLPFPILNNDKINLNNIRNNIVSLNFNYEKQYEEILTSSLYDFSNIKLSLVSIPESINSKNTNDFNNKQGELFNTIQRHALESKVNDLVLKISYEELVVEISKAKYVIIPGKYYDDIFQKRIIIAICNSLNTPVIYEDYTSSLSENQNRSLFIQGSTLREKSKSLASLVNNDIIREQILKNLNNIQDINNIYQLFFEELKLENKIILLDVVDSEEDEPIILNKVLPSILFRTRQNVFSQPGGDTIKMNRCVEGLRNLGYNIVVDTEGKEDITKYDLVQLFNFALKDHTESIAKECVHKNVPYVVDTMYEDWPKFFNKMITSYHCLNAYVNEGQNRDKWLNFEEQIRNSIPCDKWDNSFTANHASAIYVSGKNEESNILKDYPNAKRVRTVYCGSEVSDFRDGGELFRNKYGIDNFILCVGRLETRKNQLMLLKALEDSDLTLVFASSGFTYQPEYEKACRSFKRKGQTIFLERLTPEELTSAYQAAKVHALPSWYELPGLVSLEAAKLGANVVASKYGTIEDYLKEYAFYCRPDDAESICAAVTAAYYAPRRTQLVDLADSYSWDNTCKAISDLYEEVLSEISNNVANQDYVIVDNNSTEESTLTSESQENIKLMLLEGNSHIVAGKYDIAKDLFSNILNFNYLTEEDEVNVFRSLGVMYIQTNNLKEADEYFKKALKINPRDVKSLLGKGHIIWETSSKEEAYSIYKQAASLDPSNKSAILYLVSSSYELNKLEELESSLREYLREDQSNVQIQYCLAGCYYKQKKYGAATGVVERILKLDPTRKDAAELKNLIKEQEVDLSINVEESQTQIQYSLLKSKLELFKSEKKYNELIEFVNNLLHNKEYNEDSINLAKLFQAESYGCIGDLINAEKVFEELENKQFMLSRVLCGMGAIAAFTADWTRAENYFELSLSKDPKSDMPLAGLGICAESSDRFEDAWNYFTEALNRNPENLQALMGIIKLGYKIDRLELVEDNLKKYLEMKPVDLSILYSLAGCLFAQGRTIEAISELKNILIFDPQHKHASELLSEIESGKKYSNLS